MTCLWREPAIGAKSRYSGRSSSGSAVLHPQFSVRLLMATFSLMLVACSETSGNSEVTTEGLSRFVSANSLHCRSAPSKTAKEVRGFAKGDMVSVTGEQDGWASVGPPSDPCWVAASYLSDTPPEVVASSSPPRYVEAGTTSHRKNGKRKAAFSRSTRAGTSRSRTTYDAGGSQCPCSGSKVCIGPRGGRYCITSGGNKRYGV